MSLSLTTVVGFLVPMNRCRLIMADLLALGAWWSAVFATIASKLLPIANAATFGRADCRRHAEQRVTFRGVVTERGGVGDLYAIHLDGDVLSGCRWWALVSRDDWLEVREGEPVTIRGILWPGILDGEPIAVLTAAWVQK